MIDVSAEAMNNIRYGSYQLHARAWISRGGQVLTSSLPLLDGQETYDETLQVPELVQVTVPRLLDGVDLEPHDATSPTAAFGQRLHVQLGVNVGALGVEWFDRGEFLITDSQTVDDTVEISAAGLLELVNEARLVTAYQPTGVLSNVVRKLVEPALTVYVDPALTDRTVPSTLQFDDDRLGALYSVLDAWPAQCRVMPGGFLYVYPADQAIGDDWNLFTFNRDDFPYDRATVVRTTSSSSRDAVYNAVVARGTAADGGQVQGVQYDDDPASSSAYGGPFNPLPVPYYFESPLLTTIPQCNAAAITTMNRLKAATYRRHGAEVVPVPILQGRDGIYLYGEQHYVATVIEKMTLPYTPGGSMDLTLRETT